MFRPEVHFLYYQSEGLRIMEDRDESFEMRPGDVILFYGGSAYVSYGPPKPYRAMNVLFAPVSADRCLRGADAGETASGRIRMLSRLRTDRDPAIRQLFEETVLHAHSASRLRRAKASALLSQLLIELAMRSTPSRAGPPAQVEYALDHLERHLDRSVNLDELAALVGLSRRTLTRRFRGATGKSIAKYHLDARLRLAASILKTNPDIRLHEVAGTLGFYDEFHFSRAFKRHFGLSPGRTKRRSSL
ncbi:MAG: helix-turn-helix transcriptional regulator [Kiritimatiellae bacterium]|nr:helix-turn-helix transcriptional regulator [Kiritimatiellia bacterium]